MSERRLRARLQRLLEEWEELDAVGMADWNPIDAMERCRDDLREVLEAFDE